MDQQQRLKQFKSKEAIKKELVRQYTKHIEEENNLNDDAVKVKMVVVGGVNSGKTSWATYLVDKKFDERQEPTVGSSFFQIGTAIEEDLYNFDIWDVSGEDWCLSLVAMYLQHAHSAVICYDVTRRESFEQAKKWLQTVKKLGESHILIALVGTKSDLKSDIQVEEGEARKFFIDQEKQNPDLFFPNVSAKTGDNVDDVMLRVAETLDAKGIHNNDHRPSVLDPDAAMGKVFRRVDEYPDILPTQSKSEGSPLSQKLSKYKGTLKKQMSASLKSAKSGSSKFGQTLKRKSMKFGAQVKSKIKKSDRNNSGPQAVVHSESD